jgi:hypothetical protein
MMSVDLCVVYFVLQNYPVFLNVVVRQALKRLGPKKAPPGKRPVGGKATVAKAVDDRSEEAKLAFNELTDLADQLLRSGDVGIYEVRLVGDRGARACSQPFLILSIGSGFVR